MRNVEPETPGQKIGTIIYRSSRSPDPTTQGAKAVVNVLLVPSVVQVVRVKQRTQRTPPIHEVPTSHTPNRSARFHAVIKGETQTLGIALNPLLHTNCLLGVTSFTHTNVGGLAGVLHLPCSHASHEVALVSRYLLPPTIQHVWRRSTVRHTRQPCCTAVEKHRRCSRTAESSGCCDSCSAPRHTRLCRTPSRQKGTCPRPRRDSASW